ncbi:MAG TPA: hypothetical protein VHY21_09335 [Pseudonocardiaceae bacterium]|nr:hypothetical protein [Pseudonocardiaceae bacterium]
MWDEIGGTVVNSWTFTRVAGSVLIASAIALGTAAPASAIAPTPPLQDPGVGASNAVACGISYPDKDLGGWVNFPANPVTLRDGPSNSCIQTGEGLHDQRAQYYCYLPGDGGTWTLLRNTSTGAQGWVRDDLLPGDGSNVPCEQNPPPASIIGP